MPSGAVKAQSF